MARRAGWTRRKRPPPAAGTPKPSLEAARGPEGPEEEGVSPVIGAILILAITVVGITSLMVWGGPTLERVQTQNAALAMQGEFEGLRDASQELSVPDHSRFPAVAVPRGVLGIEEGTRFLVAAAHDTANPSCDLDVTGWGGTVATASVTVSAGGCSPLTDATFEVFEVTGTTLVGKSIAVAGSNPYTVTAGSADFTKGDWLFRLTDGAANPEVFAQAWLHSSDRITWELVSGAQTQAIYLEGGAIFSRSGVATFLSKAPPIGDAAYGTGYYGLWLRTFSALGKGGIDDPGTHQVFMALSSNDLHVHEDGTYLLRHTYSGDLAEAWCNSMLMRNPRQGTLLDGVFSYTADPTASCEAGDAQGLRSVTFAYDDGSPFQFRFLHARIQASLV